MPDDEYALLRERLSRAVGSVCPGWLADRKEDLVQVALMRVMEIQRKSEGNRDFSSSYLWRVAYSALVDELRRLRRRQEVPLEDPQREDTLSSDRSTPEQTSAGRETGEMIRQCLALMVRARRQAVALYLQGHTVPEAAKIMDWSGKRTENLVYRGLSDLRKCLASMGLEP